MGAFTITIPTSDGTCSTPFGITDYIGRALQAESLRALVGAQRLSASRIISAVDMPQQRRRPSLMVLNAFRHHGLYRMVISDRIVAGSITAGAQRLSASRIISAARRPHGRGVVVLNAFRHHGLYRPNQNWSSIDITGAQRLSASRIISAAVAAPVLPRRLMCSTPFGITDYIGTLHPAVTTENDAMCSTPFGITDYIGCRLSASHHHTPIEVLNAFRHHGLYRLAILNVSAVSFSECSTPFGITDYIGVPDRLCGRLTGVLNAFRHHGLYRLTIQLSIKT